MITKMESDANDLMRLVRTLSSRDDPNVAQAMKQYHAMHRRMLEHTMASNSVSAVGKVSQKMDEIEEVLRGLELDEFVDGGVGDEC